MDCFNTNYYKLNRKLLLIVGQWPYQRYADRVKIWILYFFITATVLVTQVAKAITAETNFDLCVEVFSDSLTILLTSIRYFCYTVNNAKARMLLDSMKLNWQSLTDDDEHEIFSETAETGRLYTLHYLIFIYSVILVAWIILFSPPVLKYMNLINNSYPRVVLYQAEYFIDEEKYYYLILAHMNLVVLVLIPATMATDSFFMIFMYHTIGMFKIACHRLEHVFDNYNEKARHPPDKTVCQRIASAVECHRQAIRFCDTLSGMFDTANLISVLLIVINITVTLYWTVTSKEQGFKMMFGIMLCVGQMAHILTLEVPAQQILYNSGEAAFRVYSSMWYMAPVKEQSLVLLIMQRGLKPSAMLIGNLYPITLENYATEVKASFSYFTVLMSLK